MKLNYVICIILSFILIDSCYTVFYGRGGVFFNHNMNEEITQVIDLNDKYQVRNNLIKEHIKELHGNAQVLEADARRELGLVKKGEILINFK